MRLSKNTLMTALVTALLSLAIATPAWTQERPNILVIWGDDIGYWNISAYNQGMMGYETPNIDRLANEGMIFTDAYGQQSCTAGRAAFMTGQVPFRTGLTKVGLPGSDLGLQPEDPTIAELLKPHGYATGQFGKNHLGDLDEHLPTNHGFDEFFGNLYHLNAEEEPEHEDYPKDPEFKRKYGPRGVIKSFADGRIEDTGPLTRKRMETADEEFTANALDFMERQAEADKPFFLWWNSTRMHIYTHLKPESKGKTGLGIFPDGMVGFPEKPFLGLFVVKQMLGQELQRHLAVEFGVLSLVDDTHAALAELRDELVVANALADHHDRGIVAPWEQRKGRQSVL